MSISKGRNERNVGVGYIYTFTIQGLHYPTILLNFDTIEEKKKIYTDSIVHNSDAHRFESRVNGHVAVLDYMLMGDIITFTNTGVPPVIENRGAGSRLAKAGLEYAREYELKVRSLCWFVSKFIRWNPEYQDLLEYKDPKGFVNL